MSSAPIVESPPVPLAPSISDHRPLLALQVAVRQFFHEMPPLSRGRSAFSCGHSTPTSPPAPGVTSRTTYLFPAKFVASAARVHVSPAFADIATPLSVPA